MGLIRLFLAAAVLASHTGFVDSGIGVLAVEIFFAISGFYMALLINERFASQPNGAINFYKSRAIKIYLPYYFALILTALLQVLILDKHLDFSFLSIIGNLTIFGQDIIKLFRLKYGCGYEPFTQLIVGQAWSVAIELLFYLVAPFLLTRLRLLITVFILCAVTKVGFLIHYHYFITGYWHSGYCPDALIDGIAPLELSLFCLGAIGYYFYRTKLKPLQISKRIEAISASAILFGILLIMTILNIANINFINKLSYFYFASLLIILIMPFLFWLTNKNIFDRFLGDMSYIFYLLHGISIALTNRFTPSIVGNSKFFICLALTLGFSITFSHFIENKLDSFRRKKYG